MRVQFLHLPPKTRLRGEIGHHMGLRNPSWGFEFLRGRQVPMRTKEDQRRYQREWKARRRAAFFVDRACARCGSRRDLELDHILASEKTRPGGCGNVSSQLWSWSRFRQEAELAKCQVLCASCHERKTTECGERLRGKRIGTAKLSELDVRAIRLAYSAGIRSVAIAKLFSVTQRHVQMIARNEKWRWVAPT